MLKLKNRGKPINDADLDALEAVCHGKLPGDYRRRMLRDNGGVLVRMAFTRIDGDEETEYDVATIYSVRHDDGGARQTVDRALGEMVGEDSHIKPGYIPVADDGATGRYCLDVDPRRSSFGAVFLVFMDESAPPEPIADSFEAFARGMRPVEDDEYLN